MDLNGWNEKFFKTVSECLQVTVLKGRQELNSKETPREVSYLLCVDACYHFTAVISIFRG